MPVAKDSRGVQVPLVFLLLTLTDSQPVGPHGRATLNGGEGGSIPSPATKLLKYAEY